MSSTACWLAGWVMIGDGGCWKVMGLLGVYSSWCGVCEVAGGVLKWLGDSLGGVEWLWRASGDSSMGPGPGSVPGDGGGGSVVDWADGCGSSGSGCDLGRSEGVNEEVRDMEGRRRLA